MNATALFTMKHALFVVSFCTLGLTFGCSQPQISYAPVAGTLTVDGKPIAKAEVVLTSETLAANGPKPSTRGTTDDAGHFVLRTLTSEKTIVDGAVVGKHRVFVTTRIVEENARGGTRVVREELLGRKYTGGEELTVNVPPDGVKDLRFDLPAG